MSTVSASKNIAQPNQKDNCYNLSVTTMKRKRGRPRKDGRPRTDKVALSEPNKRSKLCTVRRSPISNDGLVGREVSCSFTGVFDAGYLLTVRVGDSGPILTGLVFDPRLSVPVSAENDIAPHLPMLGRNGFSLQAEEGFINQGADSSHAGLKQRIQAKESPTTSSFTSHAQNMMEETPSQSSHVPQTVTETMEPICIPRTSSVFVEVAATETPISAGLSDISASKPSNGYNLSEVSKPSNVSEPLEAPEAVTNASGEPLNIPKEALSTTKASFNLFNDVIFDISKPSDTSKEEASVVLKPSEASENAQKICLDISKEVVSRDVAFEATQVLEHQTLKTGDIVVEKLSSEQSSQRAEEEEASKGRRIDASLCDGESPGRFVGSE